MALYCIPVTPREHMEYNPFELLYGHHFLLRSHLTPKTSPLGDYHPVLQQVQKEMQGAANLLLPSNTHLYEDKLTNKLTLIKDSSP